MRAVDALLGFLPSPRPRMFLLMFPGVLLLISNINVTQIQGRPLSPVATVSAPVLSAIAFGLLWLGSRQEFPLRLRQGWQALPRWVRSPMTRAIIATPLVLLGISTILRSVPGILAPPAYNNDAVAYLHSDADTLLQGRNPYTQSDTIWATSRRWPTVIGTPLMRGRFLTTCAICYPSPTLLKTVMQDEALHLAHRGPEYDPATAHNYPAGSLLLVLPVVWAGGTSILWLNVMATLLIVVMIWLRAPKTLRLVLAAVLLCETVALSTGFDALCIIFVVAAWQWFDRRHLSPLLLGWACAVKQLAWFFVPFYLVEVARREGWRAAMGRGAWLGTAFIVPNLPFLWPHPLAWLSSQIVPMSDPMFPLGMGIVAPALGHVWSLWPPIVYTLLEGLTWLGLIMVQARRRAITSDGILFALVPLFFARRDLINYWALLPLLATWLAVQHYHRQAITLASDTAPIDGDMATKHPEDVTVVQPA